MDVEAYMCDPEGIKDKQSLRQSVFMSLGCILFVAYWSMAYVFTVVIYTKSNVLPAVLLFSESEYRIASPCYQDPRSGIATMWGDGTDARHEPFRVLTELVQQIPSVSAKVKLTPGTIHAASAALQKPMPHLPIWACVPIFIAAMVAIPLVYISIEQIWPRVFRRERRWTVFRHCSTLAGIGSGLYVTIPLELGFHNNQTPQAEQFFQVGQWGPWAIGVVILIAAVIYKTLGLDSHDSSRTFVSVSSRRKSSGASEKEERLPLLERLPSNDSTDSSCPTETTLVEAAELSRPCASYQKDSRSIGDDGRGRPSSSSSNHTLRSNSPTESLYGETLELVPTNWSGKTVLDV